MWPCPAIGTFSVHVFCTGYQCGLALQLERFLYTCPFDAIRLRICMGCWFSSERTGWTEFRICVANSTREVLIRREGVTMPGAVMKVPTMIQEFGILTIGERRHWQDAPTNSLVLAGLYTIYYLSSSCTFLIAS